MKKVISILLFILLTGCCCKSINFPNDYVNPQIKLQYYSSVSLYDNQGNLHGSGTIIHNKAGDYIVALTAAHVIAGIQEMKSNVLIDLPYKTEKQPVIVFKIDKEKDLALLIGIEKERQDGPAVNVSKTFGKIGDNVFVIGAPLGESRTVTKGIISDIVKETNKTVYRTDAAVFFGNSGGGLFNENGELIGVLHSIYIIESIVVPGAGFAISLETIKEFI